MAGIYNDTANTGYGGYNYGGGGYYGGGYYGGGSCFSEAIVLAALLGNGFNNHDDHDRCCEKMIDMHDHHDDSNHTVDEVHKVQMEVCAAERQIADMAMMLQKCCCDTDRDILETKYALSGDIKDGNFALDRDILISRYENALQGKDIIREIDLQSCGINRNIDEVKFNQAIFAKDAQAQLAKCCCELEKQIAESICTTKQTAADTQMLIIKTDAKNDLKEAERERRALERQLDALLAKQRDRDGRDEQNVLNNFGIINDSLNKVITALGNTAV